MSTVLLTSLDGKKISANALKYVFAQAAQLTIEKEIPGGPMRLPRKEFEAGPEATIVHMDGGMTLPPVQETPEEVDEIMNKAIEAAGRGSCPPEGGEPDNVVKFAPPQPGLAA